MSKSIAYSFTSSIQVPFPPHHLPPARHRAPRPLRPPAQAPNPLACPDPVQLLRTSSVATLTTTPNAAADTSPGFSIGAKVGVAVGVIAAFGLGLSLTYFLFRRRERSRVPTVAAQPLPAFGQNNEVKDYKSVNTAPYGYYEQRELPGDLPHTEPHHIYQTPREVPWHCFEP
jgi:hypothetical protein